MSNSRLSEHYLALGRDLDVLEPKVPEDVYKSHLSDARQPQGDLLPVLLVAKRRQRRLEHTLALDENRRRTVHENGVDRTIGP